MEMEAAMTGTPRVLPEAPNGIVADLLSDLLGSMHISGLMLFSAEFREPWGVITPAACQLAGAIPLLTEHIIPFHIVTVGGCWLEIPGRERTWLQAGDAVLLPYGDSHRLFGQEAVARLVPMSQLLPVPPRPGILLISHGGEGELTHMICGYLQCDALMFHPILQHLPPLLHVSPDADDDCLAGTLRHTAIEVSRTQPGWRSMLLRLTELMFVQILRTYMQNLSGDEVGWFAAINDPVVGAALQYLHTAPMRSWSVEGLARRVGVSRTALAGRFKHFLDLPPMQYLAHWRLELAAQQLATSDARIKTIADQAGYRSEAAFSRAFKRLFGSPPGDWRRRQTVDKRIAHPLC